MNNEASYVKLITRPGPPGESEERTGQDREETVLDADVSGPQQ